MNESKLAQATRLEAQRDFEGAITILKDLVRQDTTCVEAFIHLAADSGILGRFRQAELHAVKRPGVLRRFYFKIERKKGGQIAKVATARKLLEWIYHILRDGRTYQEMEKIADLQGRGEPGKNSGSA
jgi:hypothetical protein